MLAAPALAKLEADDRVCLLQVRIPLGDHDCGPLVHHPVHPAPLYLSAPIPLLGLPPVAEDPRYVRPWRGKASSLTRWIVCS
ncbi:MAG TPA: hypothetical protein VHJ40_09570, partial [Actinomycetota bacterium]|nr:hypothetical protein [Actinomycetota bacterium]